MYFAIPADDRGKIKENEKKDMYLDFARELKKAVKIESNGDINYNWCTYSGPQRLGKGSGTFGNQRTNRDH